MLGLLGKDGGIFNFGDAPFLGSDAGKIGSASAVGIAASNGTDGGYLVLTINGFQEFSSFANDCTSGTTPLPAAGIASSLPIGRTSSFTNCVFDATSSSGAVSALEDATPHGGVVAPPAPVVGIAVGPTDTGYPPDQGYWLVDSKRGVFNLDAPSLGSMSGAPLSAPMVAIAAG